MWVIEIKTGKKKMVRIADILADWLEDEPKYKMIERK